MKPLYGWTQITYAGQDSDPNGYGHWEKALNEESDGYVQISLSVTDMNNIMDNGLRVEYGNITISYIELRQ